MKPLGTRGRVVIVEMTRDELGLIADAIDLMHDEAVQEERAEDAMAYDQLAQQAYKTLGETR